jgi:hypothetical protein
VLDESDPMFGQFAELLGAESDPLGAGWVVDGLGVVVLVWAIAAAPPPRIAPVRARPAMASFIRSFISFTSLRETGPTLAPEGLTRL